MNADNGGVSLALLEAVRKIEVAGHVDASILELDTSHDTISNYVRFSAYPQATAYTSLTPSGSRSSLHDRPPSCVPNTCPVRLTQ
jgi:hypothetical protein